MSFYSKIVDHLNASIQTKDAAKVALAARDTVRTAVKFLFEKKGELVPGDASIEFRVEGMPPNGQDGYCDYVLFGNNLQAFRRIKWCINGMLPVEAV